MPRGALYMGVPPAPGRRRRGRRAHQPIRADAARERAPRRELSDRRAPCPPPQPEAAAAAAPPPASSASDYFLEPLLRSFLLGVGAGAVVEAGHVVFKAATIAAESGPSIMDVLPGALPEFAPLFVLDHVAAL